MCRRSRGVAVAAQESLVKIDKSVPLTDAALFGCAVVTGVGAVVNTARVEAGASVVVFGLGGVGLSAVMGLKAVGAHPIVAVDRLEEKLGLALELGATHTVNAAQVDAVEAVRDLTGGGAQYAFESVGNEQVMVQAYEATRRGGTTVSIGLPHYSKRFFRSRFEHRGGRAHHQGLVHGLVRAAPGHPALYRHVPGGAFAREQAPHPHADARRHQHGL